MVDVARKGPAEEPHLRASGDGAPQEVSSLTPKEIVAELDRYIVGQSDAKRAVAVALRNRWRRQQVPEDLRAEILPRNILMIGPTGVGKTEIARRVAKIVNAPFIKIEATKFTEVGYVGRDVESIVRDLVESAVSQLYQQRLDDVMDEADLSARRQLASLLSSHPEQPEDAPGQTSLFDEEQVLSLLDSDSLDDSFVEIDVEEEGDFESAPMAVSSDEFQDSWGEFIDALMTRRRVKRRMRVKEARRVLANQEAANLVDGNAVIDDAIARAEQAGVVFIDELDKTVRSDGENGPDVSGEGVQRDLLPIVEGSTVMTRFGPVQTDHMLFIGAGAFHRARPSDLIPELQGRFPVRVELESLSEDDLFSILTAPENALARQYEALLKTEGVHLDLTEDGLRAVANLANIVNERTEDIGARRLHTMMEQVLEDIAFEASDRSGDTVQIDEAYVRERLDDIVEDDDLSNFIL